MSHRDLAEEILRRRPLYLLTRSSPDLRSTKISSVVGLFLSEQNAVLSGLRDLFFDLNFDHYDPCKRFKPSSGDGPTFWIDKWNCYPGADDYAIDEMYPDGSGRAWRKTFRFDEIVKNMVIKEKTSSQEVKDALKRWRAEVGSGAIPEAFKNVATADRRRYHEYEGERRVWMTQYGSVP